MVESSCNVGPVLLAGARDPQMQAWVLSMARRGGLWPWVPCASPVQV